MPFGESRVVVHHRGSLYHFCRLTWSDADASLYLFPPEHAETFFAGSVTIPAGQTEATYPLGDPLDGEPHLSIHQSGQTHIKVGSRIVAGPMRSDPIAELRGHHVAVIHCARFDRLPMLDGGLTTDGPNPDSVFPTDDVAESGWISVFVSEAPVFFDTPRVTVTLTRTSLLAPLYVGLVPRAFKLVDDDGSGGVFIIAGWDPTTEVAADEPLDHLFLGAR